jgi:hypothetical protein
MAAHQEEFKKKPEPPSAREEERYCPICGMDASDPILKRFGEYFCSEAHVTEYASEVRARAQGAAARSVGEAQNGGQERPKQGGLSRLLKLGACCAAPILALVILLPLLQGGTTGLAAIGGNLLYFAALLACPLGMYFMMRGMHRDRHEVSGDPKALPPDRDDPARR